MTASLALAKVSGTAATVFFPRRGRRNGREGTRGLSPLANVPLLREGKLPLSREREESCTEGEEEKFLPDFLKTLISCPTHMYKSEHRRQILLLAIRCAYRWPKEASVASTPMHSVSQWEKWVIGPPGYPEHGKLAAPWEADHREPAGLHSWFVTAGREESGCVGARGHEQMCM